MEGFENNENKTSDINLVDFSYLCRICWKRGDSRLFKAEDYLLDIYQAITRIDVRSTADSPKNICNDCIKTLADISLFIDISKYNYVEWEKNLQKNEHKHTETGECGTGQTHEIKSEVAREEFGDDLQYFRGFEICRICYSANILKPVEEKAHLMQIFQNITNIVVEPEVAFSNKNWICNKCINELETISSFISVSLSNELKLEKSIGRYEAMENCLEENSIDKGYWNKVKTDDDFDQNEPCCESKSSHTIIDIKDEIIDTHEASFDQINRNEMNGFSESLSEENPCNCGPHRDEFGTGTDLKNLLRGLCIKREIQSGTSRSKCYCCERSFTEKHSLQKHLLTHNGKEPFKCGNCNKSFTFMSNLRNHMLIHSGKKLFKCHCCERSFVRKNSLKRHLLTHIGKKSFEFNNCEKSFTSKLNLQQHVLIRSGEKLFKCNCCERSFTKNHNLQKHLLTHSGKKLFECGYCKKSFTSKSNLRKHMFTHTGEKPFKCDCCEKKFTQKSHLQEHMRIHSGEKPLKCNCCEKSFTFRSNLQQHMLIHSGEKRFKCDCCEKTFNRKRNLQQHMLTHTGEKPFKCDSCEKSFSWKSNLKKHSIKKHAFTLAKSHSNI